MRYSRARITLLVLTSDSIDVSSSVGLHFPDDALISATLTPIQI